MPKMMRCFVLILVLVFMAGRDSVQAQRSTAQTLTLTSKQALENALLHAAEAKDWAEARHLLEQGVNPNIISNRHAITVP